MPDVQEQTPLSMSFEDVEALKEHLFPGAGFHSRISTTLTLRLWVLSCRELDMEYRDIIDEITNMELGNPTTTKPPKPFTRPPLQSFHHKHYSSTRHWLRNVCDRWHIDRGNGNDALMAIIEAAIRDHGSDFDRFSKFLTYQFIIGALEHRTRARRMTGDWIVYRKHEGENYYLDLAAHEDARPSNAHQLLNRLGDICTMDFPFLIEAG